MFPPFSSEIMENHLGLILVCLLLLYGMQFEDKSYIFYSIALVPVGRCDFKEISTFLKEN